MSSKNKVRIPKQDRGIKMKERIIEVAQGLFSKKGFYNTNSNEIAARAKVSIGSFYSYFIDKKDLFLEVVKYYNDNIKKRIKLIDVHQITNIEDFLYKYINNILEAHKYYPDFHREITIMEQMDFDVKKIMDEQKKVSIEFTRNFLQTWKGQIKIENIEAATFVIYNLIEKIIHEIVFSESKIKEENLIKEIVNMILKYVF